MKPIIKWSLITLGVGLSAFAIIKIVKKRKQKKEEAEASAAITTTNTSGSVYYGLTTAQTLELQKHINQFIDKSGALSGFANISNQVDSGYVDSPIILSAINATTVNPVTKSVTTLVTPASMLIAFGKFKQSVTEKLKEDGIYGTKTMQAVKALQTYLNTTQNVGLTVDGKYGPKTDDVTGWDIC